jgi:predicted peptidase
MESHGAVIRLAKTIHLRYLLHVPPSTQVNVSQRWPTILFLHGRGESGDDPITILRHGLPRYITQHSDFPFIVIAPLCPWNTWWPELADSLAYLLDECTTQYPVDPHRLYLTGLSMGGFGSWYMATAWPERFAAVAPICGGGYWFHGFPQRVCILKDTPVWAFHGAQDDVVPLTVSEELVSALRECGGNVEFTVYPDAGHDSWTVTYNNPELYSWFLQQARK